MSIKGYFMDSFVFEDISIKNINKIIQFLAVNDFCTLKEDIKPDMIILAGNDFLPGAEGAFRLASQTGIPLLISGGIGHATAFLQKAVADNVRYHALDTVGKSEAEILQAVATTFWNIPASQILLETKATNGGENGLFTRQLLEKHQMAPEQVILVQDPAMQRRATATFTQAWQGMANPSTLISWPVIVPKLVLCDGTMTFSGPASEHPASIKRFVSLVMGEIPRLRDDKNGYGPKGRGFIPHVDIPDEIEVAYAQLVQYFSGIDNYISR